MVVTTNVYRESYDNRRYYSIKMKWCITNLNKVFHKLKYEEHSILLDYVTHHKLYSLYKLVLCKNTYNLTYLVEKIEDMIKSKYNNTKNLYNIDGVTDTAKLKPKLTFNTVQQFELPNYTVTASFRSLTKTIDNYISNDGLDLDPPFQRGYVWSEKQRTDFMEYVLRNGELSPIYFNSPDWARSCMNDTSNLVLIDGKQRLSAILDFIDNKVPVFDGYYCNEIEGLKLWKFHITIAINSLSEADAVRWYISMNTGGSIHTASDIEVAVEHLNEITKGNYVSKKKLSLP